MRIKKKRQPAQQSIFFPVSSTTINTEHIFSFLFPFLFLLSFFLLSLSGHKLGFSLAFEQLQLSLQPFTQPLRHSIQTLSPIHETACPLTLLSFYHPARKQVFRQDFFFRLLVSYSSFLLEASASSDRRRLNSTKAHPDHARFSRQDAFSTRARRLGPDVPDHAIDAVRLAHYHYWIDGKLCL